MTLHFPFLRLFKFQEWELRLFDKIVIYVEAKLTLKYFQVRKNNNFSERLTKVAECRLFEAGDLFSSIQFVWVLELVNK